MPSPANGGHARREAMASASSAGGHSRSTLLGSSLIGVTASSDLGVPDPPGDPEVLAQSSTRAVVLSEQDALVLGEERVARVRAGEDRQHLDDPRLADLGHTEVARAADDHVGEVADVEHAAL